MIENVIVVNDFGYIDGGASKIAIETAIELANNGIKVTFFCSIGPICESLNHQNIKVILLNQKECLSDKNRIRGIVNGIFNIKAYYKLNKLLNELKDKQVIVHIHTWTKGLSSSVFLALKRKNIKSVITLHDYFSICPNGGLFNFKKCNICTIRPMSLNCISSNCDSRNYIFKIFRIMRFTVQNKLINLNEIITSRIFVSNFSKEIFKEHIDYKKDIVLPNPINLHDYEKVDIRRNKYIAFIGRLEKEKGVELLAKMALRINNEVIFIGDGKYKDEIYKIYQNAKVTGWVNSQELREILKSIRVVIAPSLLYETMGLAPLEAIAAGIPVLVSKTYAATEYVIDGINGYCFETNNIDDLIEKFNCIDYKIKNDEFKSVSVPENYEIINSNEYINKLIKHYCWIFGDVK